MKNRASTLCFVFHFIWCHPGSLERILIHITERSDITLCWIFQPRVYSSCLSGALHRGDGLWWFRYGGQLPPHLASRPVHDDCSAKPGQVLHCNPFHANLKVRRHHRRSLTHGILRGVLPRLARPHWQAGTFSRECIRVHFSTFTKSVISPDIVISE